MTKDIKLKQPIIETNKVLEGTENYLNYCLLASYIIVFILLLIKSSTSNLFYFVFIASGLVVAGNVYSFKKIKENLLNAEANNEIEQLDNIISSEPENADAYYLRGCANKTLKAYRSAFHDFKMSKKFITNLSEYLKETLNKEFEECQLAIKKNKNS